MGVDRATFYDPSRVANIPMGFCYPGTTRDGADAPPRPECAPLWHDRLLRSLDPPRLTLLVGRYAQAVYLPRRGATMTDAMRSFLSHGETMFPLPHPSWRNNAWIVRNPWFADEVLPVLRERVAAALNAGS
jgi:uracil-DNA glycosylase